MSGPEDQLALLKEICPDARLLDEAGGKVAYLPGFEWTHVGAEQKMDLLLIPFPHSGYDNRLFFQHQLPTGTNPQQPGWTQHLAIDRTWWSPSVRGVMSNWPWPQMVSGFLRVVG